MNLCKQYSKEHSSIEIPRFSRIPGVPELSWKLDGLKWVYIGVALNMNLISLKISKTIFTAIFTGGNF